MDSNINRVRGIKQVQRVDDTQRANARQVSRRATSAYESQRLERASETSAKSSSGVAATKAETTIKVEEAAELRISDTGRQMAAEMVAANKRTAANTTQAVATRVTNATDARATIARIGEVVAKQPEIGADLHSNLRIMRVNQLIFE